jgi:hypothetical protein
MNELKAFAEWLKAKGDILKLWPIDKLVEEFKREQAIREEHKDDATDAGR